MSLSTRGRKRVPTALRKLAGNPSRRPLPEREPQPALCEPPAPKELQPAARAEWKRMARILANVRVLTEGDIGVLYGYAVSFAEAREAEAILKEDGVLVVDTRVDAKTGKVSKITKRHPAQVVATAARKQYMEFERELGMTPVTRSKVTMLPEKEGGELVSFEGGKK